MGVNVKLSELAENIGNNTADFIDNLAEETRKFACNLWNLYPDQISQNQSLGSSFARGFMSNMCQDFPPPPAPSIPFSGGQCPGSRYIVRVRWTQNNGSLYRLLTLDVFGPIQSIIGFFEPNNPSDPSGAGQAIAEVQAFLQNGTPFLFTNSGPESGPPDNDPTYEVEPFPGNPNNCGDPALSYPPTNPQPSDYTTNINIQVNDGGTIQLPLTYSPNNYFFPMSFNLGGIDLEIDLGGINFDFGSRNSNDTPNPLPDGQTNPLPTPNDDGNRSIPERRIPPPNLEDYDEEDRTETDPKEEDVGDQLRFVRVVVTLKPSNVKNQWGDGAPNVYYCGWFEFQAGGYNFRREPIHWENSIFAAPPGATGYAYTLYEGFKGFAEVYKIKDQ